MEGGIADGEISDKNRTQNVVHHGNLLNESNAQAKNFHLTNICNHLKGEICTNNNSTTSTDPTSKVQQERQQSEGDTSVSDRSAKQNTNMEASQPIGTTTMGEGNKTKYWEDSIQE